jgi:hypothetical protein
LTLLKDRGVDKVRSSPGVPPNFVSQQEKCSRPTTSSRLNLGHIALVSAELTYNKLLMQVFSGALTMNKRVLPASLAVD